MKSLLIGNIKLKNPILLAPMVDITDFPYRVICRKNGASIAYTEMLHIESLIQLQNKKPNSNSLQNKIFTKKIESPVGLQLTGRSVVEFKHAAVFLHKLVSKKFALIDINCGCPSHLTIDNESGAYLLNNPQKISEIISFLKNENFIVTAKIRKGFDSENYLKVAKLIEKSGADAITLHGRLASEGRSTPADWNAIKKLKKEIGIPLIGNGDINSPKKAFEMLEIADGAMIARAAIGNPLIFKNTLHYLKTGKEKEFSFKDNIKQFNDYILLSKKYDLIDLTRIKYLGSNFIREIPGASKLRNEFMKLKSFEEIEEFVKRLIIKSKTEFQ